MKAGRMRVAGAVIVTTAALFVLSGGGPPGAAALDATPTPDRLATPIMPESPTQIDVGRNLYYYHCMPCHGDRGQGLTDEWREAWVHDHQNCWWRGCHRGISEQEGFFLPRYVPPVSGSPQALKPFRTAEDLFVFLHRTQPPQRPGTLSEDEYWALAAFLLHENGRLSPGVQIGPGAAGRATLPIGVTLGLLLTMLLVLWAGKRRKDEATS